MKSVKDHLGAYTINSRGVTLSHIWSEDDAVISCLPWIICSAPFNFDHPENDPVDLAFGLDMGENQKHGQAANPPAKQKMDAGMTKTLRESRNKEDDIQVVLGG